MNAILGDFQPANQWELDSTGEKYNCCSAHRGQPRFIIDLITNRRYLNESPGTVRTKSALLLLGTPLVHSFAAVINIVCRILKLVTFSHFWAMKKGEKSYSFKTRLVDAGKDLLRIAAAPLSILGLELAALYGLFKPYDGRKLYAALERATYGSFILAPCFQPDPKYHALGGDINEKDVF